MPNAVLVKEHANIAQRYGNQSVAEQSAVDLSWDLLMRPEYQALRECIYSTLTEMTRFRQIVVNTVMATDIIDKDLGELRRRRWDKAFSKRNVQASTDEEELESMNRKATIVIEHLIQASDVAHTMQHWHVYLKWNKRLFLEVYQAYKTGRSKQDPSKTWYQEELRFFDDYVIPLAVKLKECGVFGVSGDEYLDYAVTNRREWSFKGCDIVANYLSEVTNNKPLLKQDSQSSDYSWSD